jgi:hypothetical protein
MRRTLASGCLALSLIAGLAACSGGPGVDDAASGVGGSGGAITGAGGGATSASSGSTTSVGHGSTSSASGTGGGAPVCPPAGPFGGAPITSTDGVWEWISIPGAKCRDGSEAGFGIRKNAASDKLLVYLEGGGACFNAETCAIALSAFDEGLFDGWKGVMGNAGIFDAQNPDNPVKGWNAVYVPYCSGDVHAGDATNVSVPGVAGTQTFVGYANMGLFLQRLVPTFKNVKQVLLTGISAGGFGAAFNYDRMAAAFCPTPVALVDDSGPPMADAYLPACLQKQWRTLWKFDKTIPADCTDCENADGGGIVNYVPYLAKKWPSSRLGLISSTHDSVISAFYGFGADDCQSVSPVPGDVYAQGLEDLRNNYMSSTGLWGTYYVDSLSHTYLLTSLYTTTVDGHPLADWMRDLLDGQPGNVGP